MQLELVRRCLTCSDTVNLHKKKKSSVCSLNLSVAVWRVLRAPGSVQIAKLKVEIERVAGQQPYMGEQMPIRWLRFEQQLTQRADSGTTCATLSQVLWSCATLSHIKLHLDWFLSTFITKNKYIRKWNGWLLAFWNKIKTEKRLKRSHLFEFDNTTEER